MSRLVGLWGWYLLEDGKEALHRRSSLHATCICGGSRMCVVVLMLTNCVNSVHMGLSYENDPCRKV